MFAYSARLKRRELADSIPANLSFDNSDTEVDDWLRRIESKGWMRPKEDEALRDRAYMVCVPFEGIDNMYV